MASNSDIILAAINAAGPNDGTGDYAQRVIDSARQVAVFLSEGSAVDKAVTQMRNSKRFVGTVVGVTKEDKSNRVVVTLQTGTDRSNVDAVTKQPLPEGQEQVRTERLEDPSGYALAVRVRDHLKGRRVLAWVEVEEMKNGNKVRVLRHVEDLGEAN